MTRWTTRRARIGVALACGWLAGCPLPGDGGRAVTFVDGYVVTAKSVTVRSAQYPWDVVCTKSEGSTLPFDVVAAEGVLFVTAPQAVRVYRPSDCALLRSLPVPGGIPFGLAYDGTALWVADFAGPVVKLDPSTGARLLTVATEGAPYGALFDGESIWISVIFTNQERDHVLKIRPSDGTILARVEVAPRPFKATYHDGVVWVPSHSGTVTRIDAASGTFLGESIIGGLPTAAAVHRGELAVTDGSEEGTVVFLSLSDGSCLRRCSSEGSYPYGLVSDGRLLWVDNGGDDEEPPTLSALGVLGPCLAETACIASETDASS